MANRDINYDGTIDSGDNYALDILCYGNEFIPDTSSKWFYDKVCADYDSIGSNDYNVLTTDFGITYVSPFFPLALPTNAIDEGSGLGYYVYDNNCVSAWGTDCIPQQEAHFIATYVEPDPPPLNVVGGLTQVQSYEIIGILLALFIAYLWIRVFALRGVHA